MSSVENDILRASAMNDGISWHHQTEKFYFVHKRSFSPENFVQKCRKLSQINMSLIRFSLVDDPQTQ